MVCKLKLSTLAPACFCPCYRLICQDAAIAFSLGLPLKTSTYLPMRRLPGYFTAFLSSFERVLHCSRAYIR